MIIELHYLQNFAPSNLNRDDTGAPKDCDFGGHRRARISSQCLKRAMRQAFGQYALFGANTESHLATRTKRFVHEVAGRLAARGKQEEEANAVVRYLLDLAKLSVGDDGETQYLLYLPRRTMDGFAKLAEQHWDDVLQAAKATAPVADSKTEGSAKKGSKKDKKAGAAVHTAVVQLLKDGRNTPDLALFGRMIANSPDWNVDAACQVAHAFSTNRVNMEFDFYTAVDDLRPKGESGAGMMGTIAFQSACFYRYSCLQLDALQRNLGTDDASLPRQTLGAFLRASALAIPTGKQNSMAAQNRPSYLLAAVRSSGTPMSLANAFVKPVREDASVSLVAASVQALERYRSDASRLWGDSGVQYYACGESELSPSAADGQQWCSTFEGWVESVVSAGFPS